MKKLIWRSFILLTLVPTTAFSKDHKFTHPCDMALSSDGKELNKTESFLAYATTLFKAGVINTLDIQAWIDALEQSNELINPLYKKINSQSSSLYHSETLQGYVQQADLLDKKIILDWMKAFLAKNESTQKNRNQSEEVTKKAVTPLKFYPIAPGKFKMGSAKNDVELTTAFEMMSTPVTVSMWFEIYGYVPHLSKYDSMVLQRDKSGNIIKVLQPDFPMIQVSWWAAIDFANKLSEKFKLPPAYDTSQVDFSKSTGAKYGTLRPSDQAAFSSLKINAHEQNIYLAQGFRLPTQAEQEFVLTDRGRSAGAYFSNVDISNLHEYAWFIDNSDRKFHPIGEKKALIIDGHPFFDLFGNVAEWSQDPKFLVSPKGVNPLGPQSNTLLILKGGAKEFGEQFLEANHSQDIGYNSEAYEHCGFRLVRSLPK